MAAISTGSRENSRALSKKQREHRQQPWCGGSPHLPHSLPPSVGTGQLCSQQMGCPGGHRFHKPAMLQEGATFSFPLRPKVGWWHLLKAQRKALQGKNCFGQSFMGPTQTLRSLKHKEQCEDKWTAPGKRSQAHVSSAWRWDKRQRTPAETWQSRRWPWANGSG